MFWVIVCSLSYRKAKGGLPIKDFSIHYPLQCVHFCTFAVLCFMADYPNNFQSLRGVRGIAFTSLESERKRCIILNISLYENVREVERGKRLVKLALD